MSRIGRAVLNAQESMEMNEFIEWMNGRIELHVRQEQENERLSKTEPSQAEFSQAATEKDGA